MEPIPTEHEWIEFFGTSPHVREAAPSWPHHVFAFVIEEADDLLTVEIAPHYDSAVVLWRRRGEERPRTARAIVRTSA